MATSADIAACLMRKPLAWHNPATEEDVCMLPSIFPHPTPHKNNTLTFKAREKESIYCIIAADGDNTTGKYKSN